MSLSTLRRTAIMAVILLLAAAYLVVCGTGTAAAEGTAWNEYPGNPVYDPAAGRAYYPCVIYDANQFSGHGDTYYYKMWYGDTDSSRWEWIVYSNDGINWENPEEVTGIAAHGYHAKLVYVEGGYGAGPYYYKIWYWDPDADLYSINAMRTADSADGVNWVNDQVVTQDSTYRLVVTQTPTVEWNSGTYGPVHVLYNPSASNTGGDPFDYSFTMYYDGTTGGVEVIGLGYSADGNHWYRYGDYPVLGLGAPGAWDSNYVGNGTVIRESTGVWHMWFSGGQTQLGDGIGYASSSDGINWTKDADNPILSKNDGVAWRNNRTYTPSVIYSPGKFDGHGYTCLYKMWFTGRSSTGNYAIGYMTSLDPELSLAKSSDPSGEVEPGQEITYTLTLTNQGVGTAYGSLLTDTMPAYTTYVSSSTTLNGVAVSDVGGVSPLQTGMAANSPGEGAGEIAPSDQAAITFQVTVDADAPDGSDIVNQALAVCSGDPSSSTAQASNHVHIPGPVLSLSKQAYPAGTVTRGSVIAYTMRLANTGDEEATGAVLRDAAPQYTSYVTGTTTLNGLPAADMGGTSPLASGMVVNSPGEPAGVIAPGEEAVVTMMVQVGNDLPLGATVSNTATASADGMAAVDASSDNPTPPDLPPTWYFAEGSTQPGFDEYILLSNMGDTDMTVTITYITEDGTESDFLYLVPAHSRSTVYVNGAMPGEAGVAAIVTGGEGLICERSMYYQHNGIAGGDDVIGANSPSIDLFFAEGFTGTPGSPFEEWLLLLNPNPETSDVTIDYLFSGGEATRKTYSVPGRRRVSINVDGEVGEGREVSARLRSELPIVAERAMYFVYNGVWPGGHNGMAATGPRSDWYLAEGYTGWEGSQFDEWILVANENEQPAVVTVTYMFPDGSTKVMEHMAAARSRLTVSADAEVGQGQMVSTHIHSNVPVVVERAMYFAYRDAWQGGHNCLGASVPAADLYFAEGYTGNTSSQFETWVLVQNTADETKTAWIDYILMSGEIIRQELELPAHSRTTVFANKELGRENLEFSIRVTSKDGTAVLLAERAMYFSYVGPMGGSQGGHDVVGY